MKTPLRVLIVEDSESDADLIIRHLKKAEYSVHHERVEIAKEMKVALEKQTWDIVISDYKLPRFDAPAALALLQKTNLDIPFIVVSGTVGEATAVELMKSGASDYLMKDKLTRLAPVVKRELAEAQMRRECKQSEDALREKEARLSLIYDNVNDVIYTISVEPSDRFRFTSVNRRFIEVTGLSEDKIVGKFVQDVIPKPAHALVLEKYKEAIKTKHVVRWEEVSQYPSGMKVGEVTVAPVFDAKGNCKQLIGTVHDITERKRVEEENKLFAQTVKSAKDCISITDLEDNILFVNDAFIATYGYSETDLIGKNISIIRSHAVSSEQSRSILSETIKSGWHGEVLNKRKNGTEFIVELWTSIVRNNSGNPIAMVGIARDITERKQAEKVLQESEERYRRLTEFSPDAILVHSEGKIVYVNPAAITLLAANNMSDLIGKPFLDIIHPDYRDFIHQQIIAVVKESYALPLTEQKFIRLDGSIVEVEVAALPIAYKNKSAMQLVVRDISEQKKLQSQLVQTQKIQSLGTLAGGIAHDFNNILGIILAYSSLLDRDKIPPDKFAVSIAAINQAVQRGAALVRQILTFARKTDIVFEPMDVSELIHELHSMLEQTFPKTITLSENITSSLPLIIADRTQIHQALLNLCINARDAMPHGGSISIAAEKQTKEQMNQKFPAANEEAYICLTVTDTGKGMDEATCLRVFDPFFTTKEKGTGTGLGLSVVYGVVQAHQGFIDLKSELDRGTTFRLFFPVPTIDEQAFHVQQPVESFEIGGTETILFVEDEELLVQMVSFLLESKGYKVLCARDGLEAVNVYLSNKQEIALVITDMGLPALTGTDEFKKLKDINPSVKVVFASGYFEPDVKSELLKDGANGFIQKPYEPDDILRIIRQVLDKKE